MNRFTQYSIEQSQQPKGWLLVSRKAGDAYESRKIRPDLLGVPGAQGLPGLKGADGQPGAKGATGSKGTSGAQGDAGATGANGAPGVYPEEVLLWDCACFDSFEQYAAGSVVGTNGGLGFSTPWAASNATIVSRTNRDGTTEKRCAISQGYLARRMPWGSNWNAIEIVFTGRINNPGVATFGTVGSDGGRGYYVGVCSGTANTAYSLTCANFVGHSGKQAALWFWAAGTQTNVFSHVPGRQPTWRVGNVDTTVADFGSSFPTFSVDEGFHSIYTLRLERSAFVGNNPATYTFYLGNGLTTPAEFDWPKQTLMESFARRSNMAENLPGGLAPQTGTMLGVTETTGQLDTLNITWPWSDPLEIASVLVRRIY